LIGESPNGQGIYPKYVENNRYDGLFFVQKIPKSSYYLLQVWIMLFMGIHKFLLTIVVWYI